MNKKATITLIFLVFIVLIVGFLGVAYGKGWFTPREAQILGVGTTEIRGTVPINPKTGEEQCGTEDIAMYLKSLKAGDKSTTPTEEWFLEIGGVLEGKDKAEGSSTTVAVYKPYRAIHAWNQSDKDTAYYATEKKGNTGCGDPFKLLVESPAIETSFASSYIRDADGSLNADAAFTTAISTEYDIEWVYKCSSEEYFGSPNVAGKNIFIVEYNNSVFESGEWDVKGEITAHIPGWFPNAHDGRKYKAFTAPKCGDGSMVVLPIHSKTTSTAIGGATEDPIFHILDISSDIHAKTFDTIIGFEDESGTQLSRGNQSKNWDVSP